MKPTPSTFVNLFDMQRTTHITSATKIQLLRIFWETKTFAKTKCCVEKVWRFHLLRRWKDFRICINCVELWNDILEYKYFGKCNKSLRNIIKKLKIAWFRILKSIFSYSCNTNGIMQSSLPGLILLRVFQTHPCDNPPENYVIRKARIILICVMVFSRNFFT